VYPNIRKIGGNKKISHRDFSFLARDTRPSALTTAAVTNKTRNDPTERAKRTMTMTAETSQPALKDDPPQT